MEGTRRSGKGTQAALEVGHTPGKVCAEGGAGVMALDSACGSVCLGVMWECLGLVRVYLCLAGCGHVCLWPVE